MLNVKRFALAGGILFGVMFFLVTWVSISSGYAGDVLKLMEGVYPGYHVTPVGSVVGLFYGFVKGFVGFGFFSWIYNGLESYVK
jgi:hypothetical protein